MTQAEYGVVLSLFLIAAVFTLVLRFDVYRRERLKIKKYRLFAVRDRLVRLVAEDKIEEDDPVFQFLYRGLNRAIPRIAPLSLPALVEALNASRLAQDSREWAEFIEKFKESVEHEDPAVRETAREMFTTLYEILYDSSLFVKLSVLCTRFGYRFAKWCGERLASLPMFKVEADAYRLHQKLHARKDELAAAAGGYSSSTLAYGNQSRQ